ncbi:hypothetical protein [Streptomyces peucetius]
MLDHSAAPDRAHIGNSRSTSEVPQPQTLVSGRAQWAHAVAHDRVDARQHFSEGIRATMSAGDRDDFSPGAADVRDRFAPDFHTTLCGCVGLKREHLSLGSSITRRLKSA